MGLAQAELLRLAEMFNVVRLQPKEILFCRGDPGDHLYLVVDGVVRIGTLAAEGREITLNLIPAGDVFGEIAAFDGSARTADATAVDRVTLMTLRRDQLLHLLSTHPEASMRMLAALCDRLRWVSGLLEDANFLDIRGRLAKRLILLGRLFGKADAAGQVQISLKLSQTDLASHVGATRESVNKQLRRWEEEGAIAYEHGRLTILAGDVLAAAVEETVL